jgi:hypothetical protein
MLDNQDIRAELERHWEATVTLDLDRAHDIYHDDLIVEYSGGNNTVIEL